MLKNLSKITNAIYGGKITTTWYDRKENVLYIDVKGADTDSLMEIIDDDDNEFAIAILYI